MGRIFRGAMLCTMALTTSFGAGEGSAARGVAIDAYPESVSLCTLGFDGCGTFNSSLGDIRVYAEGIVSFGGPLSGSASTAGGVSSFGAGTWFTPGFTGETYQALAIRTNLLSEDGSEWGLAINFYKQGVAVEWPTFDGDPGTLPLFQVQIGPLGLYDKGSQVAFAYGNSPAAGAVIAYHAGSCSDDGSGNQLCDSGTGDAVVNDRGLRPGASDFVVDFDPYSTRVKGAGKFTLVRDAMPDAVPEPAAWALMLIGFALVGRAVRRDQPTRRYA